LRWVLGEDHRVHAMYVLVEDDKEEKKIEGVRALEDVGLARRGRCWLGELLRGKKRKRVAGLERKRGPEGKRESPRLALRVLFSKILLLI
jgi:hydrogenase maturation factor HypF (carbamoyltransferase family)